MIVIGHSVIYHSFMNNVTQILSKIEAGDQQASSDLLPLMYDELRILAARRMADERKNHTLQTTALVHEAYIRLVDVEEAQHWKSRGHFFAAAAEAMRRILVDQARQRGALKRGGGLKQVDIDAVEIVTRVSPDQLLAIDEAVARLAEDDPPAAQIVKLRYYAGLSVEQAAETLGLSTATAYRHWAYARAWLHSELLTDTR